MKFSARFRSPRTFLFYHNFKRLSSTFFEVFQLLKSRLAKLSAVAAAAFAAAFRLYHTSARLSSPFFEVFQLLKRSYPNPTGSDPTRRSFQSSFPSLAQLSTFVKNFFHFFSNLSSHPHQPSPFGNFYSLAHPLPFVKTHFSFAFDRCLIPTPQAPALFRTALADSLHILAHT